MGAGGKEDRAMAHDRRLDRRRLGRAIAGGGLGFAGLGVVRQTLVNGRERQGLRYVPPVATPRAAAVAGGVVEMLRFVPASVVDPATPISYVGYADFAGQLAALGLGAPGREDSDGKTGWYLATRGFAVPAQTELASTGAWFDVFGWIIHQVDQALEYLEPDQRVQILRGHFDVAGIRSALERSGYQTIPSDGATIYSLFPDRELDVNNQASLLMLGDLNNIALRDDGLLIGTGTLEHLERALAVANGGSPSAAVDPGTTTLLGAVEEPLATAVLVPGAFLKAPDGNPYEEFIANPNVPPEVATRVAEELGLDEERPQLPPVRLVLMGTTAGGPLPESRATASIATPAGGAPDATIWAYVLFDTVEAAEEAIPLLRERAWAPWFGPPWDGLEGFERATVRVAPGLPVAILDLGGGSPRYSWRAMLLSRQLFVFDW
jgi:hypothetical protein